MCTGANCNDTLQVNIPTATPGADGASAYVYIASADSNTGTNFSYPQDETQAYVAILSTTSPITSPAVGDFTGLWRKVNGTDGAPGTPGTNGTNGISSGIRYNFLNYGLAGNPGSGNLSVSGADLSLVSNIYISETNLDSVDISALLTAVGNTTSSTIKGFIKITKESDQTKFAVYSINSVTDSGAFQTLNVNYLSSTAVNTFVAGDDLLIEFYLTGDKGDKGDPGATGAFIIGTIGSGTQAYPPTATQGSAYRFTGSGTISDSAAGVLNVKRFNEFDVLYCIADTTSSDGSKYFIWTGFPRGLVPGAGTDAFVQNTAGGSTATGNNALALNSGSNAGGLNSLSGSGSNVTGDYGVGFGLGSVVSAEQSVALSCYAKATALGASALANAAEANAVSSVAVAQSAIITVGATESFNASARGLTKAAAKQSSALGKEATTEFPGEVVIGHGNFDSGKKSQSATRLIPQAVSTSGATPTVMTFMPAEISGLVIPTDSVWMVDGTIVGVRTTTEEVASWTFKCLVKNIAGTAAIVDSVLYLDPATGTYQNTVTQFAQDAGMDSGTTTVDLAVTVSTTNLVLTVTGIAATTIRWSGSLNVEQVGWF